MTSRLRASVALNIVLGAALALDGVHLTGAGYERWAAAVSSSLLLK